MKTIQHAHYLLPLLNGQAAKYADSFVKLIQESKVEFKYIVVRGLSGILMGTLVAAQMGKALAIVRKKDEGCHGFSVEAGGNWGDTMKGDFIIIDDLIDSGATMQAIFTEMKEYHILCSGIFLYYQNTKHGKRLKDCSVGKNYDYAGFNPKIYGINVV
jgi:adenine/guanine phosphoribosyltransferase-like PRPP-binding protein